MDSKIIFQGYNLYEHSVDESNRRQNSQLMAMQPDGNFGYFNTNQFSLTSSNHFTGNQTIDGDLNVNGNVRISTLISASTIFESGSTIFGNSGDDIHQFTGSLDVSGSSNFHNHIITMTGSVYTSGSQSITGSLDIKGNINVASGSNFYLAGNKLFNYAQFSDTTTQSGSANTALKIRYNTVDFAEGFTIVSGSRITAQHTGMYNLQFSAQYENTDNTNVTVDIWLAYNGVNIPGSAGSVDVNKVAGQMGRVVAAWNSLILFHTNDYVELVWSQSASTVVLLAEGTGSVPPRPAIPSIIVTMTQVS